MIGKIPEKGIIALMGSGELTSTMVEVHKELLARTGPNPVAFFLDTPAGFQLNADRISAGAAEYFKKRVQHPMAVASFKSRNALSPWDAEKTYASLRKADYVLIGPGSPTYAVRQLRNTPIPEILKQNIERGACLTAASAAALTVGAYALPVYEIYKVGENIHWADGLNILARLGLRLVPIPHWNNAEGGTHDTRFCFMGKKRFEKLVDLLPEEESILGIDEHTACIFDFEKRTVGIRGAGRVVLKRGTEETVFEKGDRVPLSFFTGEDDIATETFARKIEIASRDVSESTDLPHPQERPESFWDNIRAIEEKYREHLQGREFQKVANQLLELDRVVWKAKEDLESEEFISQSREIFREFVVLAGTEADLLPKGRVECLSKLVEGLLELRARFRENGMWEEADFARDCLRRADIVVEDAPEGPRWRVEESGA